MMDKEYAILSIIDRKKDITQRELSREMGVSLGTINALINRMINCGFIRIKQLPDRKVVYMLTPEGAQEKARKTLWHIRQNYSFIQQVKDKIRDIFDHEKQSGKEVCVIIKDDEIGHMIRSIISEFDNIEIGKPDDCLEHKTCIVADIELYEALKRQGVDVVNILNKL